VAGGVLASFVVVVFTAAALVRYSVKIPIRQLFGISSLVMVLLSLILIGKAVHSFQETGLLSITTLPFRLRIDLLGIYPTWETLIPQLVLIVVSVLFWWTGRQQSARRAAIPARRGASQPT